MKAFILLLIVAVAASFSSAGVAGGQGFTAGSTGADGALVVQGQVTVNLPPDGVLNYTTVHVQGGGTLRFARNALNTPVYILATGDVVIDGTIDVSGSCGNVTTAGRGGPGGFDGGSPGAGGPAGAGLGPGAGQPGQYASHATRPNDQSGPTYGNALLVPLVGGSGSGGFANSGGCGGGGAILIASDSTVFLNGEVRADSGDGAADGSGGAMRVVAPRVTGAGRLRSYTHFGGAGRARIDTLDRSGLVSPFTPSFGHPVGVIGSFMVVTPPDLPRLDIVSAAGTAIAEGTAAPVLVQLPLGSPSMQNVTVQARNFAGMVPISIVVIPESGPAVSYEAAIDMAQGDPAQASVNVTIPGNTRTQIQAWTR